MDEMGKFFKEETDKLNLLESLYGRIFKLKKAGALTPASLI